jgi:hypothetical protein
MAFLDDVLTRVPTAQITREARQIHFWRTVLTLLAGLFFGLGWLAARGFGFAWFALAWTATAVKVGWVEGRKPRRMG